MEKHTFNIPNISCGHCTAAIESELKAIDGIADVQGDIAEKTVTVRWDAPVTLDRILNILKEINYPAAP
jgi:copper chaperone CopZ